MPDPNLPESHPASIGDRPFVVHLNDRRELALRRLPSGSLKLEWSTQARDGSRRITASQTFGEALTRQTLAACALLHQRVLVKGLPNAS